jgi:hypothetical protein
VSTASTLDPRIGARTPLDPLTVTEESDEEFYAREFTQKPIDLTCPEHGVHTPWLPSKAREMWCQGYSDREIFQALFSATRIVRHRAVTETEIQQVIDLIISTSVDSLHVNGHNAARQKTAFEPCTLDTRIRAYVARMPAAISGSGGHVATLKVANALVLGFGLSIDDAWPYLEEYNARCEPPWTMKELEHKLTEADANKKELVRGYLLDAPSPESMVRPRTVKPKPKELTEEEKILGYQREIIGKIGNWRADPANVREASLIRLMDDYDGDARVAIACLHDPDDLINVNPDYRIKPDGRVDIVGPGVVRSAGEWNEYLATHPMPYREAGLWWRHNPVKSRRGSGKNGAFTDADIARFRYHLFEIDKLSMELQLSFFCKMRVPVAMISDSGGKSYHALVKSHADNLVEFEEEAKYLLDEVFAKYGVDPKNKNPSRYSRLPGVPRVIGGRPLEPGETEARQKILFLNPNAVEGKSIL